MSANQAQTRTSSLERVGLVGVTLVGMALCLPGIGKVAASGQWLSFPGIAGSLLGIVILGIVGARLLDRPLPFVHTDRAAIAAVVAFGLVKAAIAAVAL